MRLVWALAAAASLLLLTAAAPNGTASEAAAEALSGAEVVNGTRSAAMTRHVDEKPSRPGVSRAALVAAARAAMAARAAGAVRAAGLALSRQRATLRPLPAAPPGTVLVLGPVANHSAEPRCANITSVSYSVDMLLGTWYVVSVLSPVQLGPVCGGFQLTRLNVSGAGHDSEAVIVSRFGRQPGGPVAYVNRTMLVSNEDAGEDGAGQALQEQLAVTYYAPDGRLLTITACSPEGERLTYVYARRPAPPSAEAMGALRRRLAANGIETRAAETTTTTTTTTTTDSSLPRVKVLPQPTRRPFDVTECGWWQVD